MEGFCCICGKQGPLSYEHVPPQAAYNKARVSEYQLQDVVYKTGKKGSVKQGGIGAHTLCEQCNNNTGAWYGREFVQWAGVCQDIIHAWQKRGQTQGRVTLHQVCPLRFLKQVVTCFFSVVGGPGGVAFAQNNPGLVQFILDRNEQALPTYHFFLNLYPFSEKEPSALRRFPIAGKMKVIYDKKGNIRPVEAHGFSEITHPPFALAMTRDTSFFGATDITQFQQYGYDDCVDLDLELRIVSSTSPYPAGT
jgi:hypothetical protein